MSLISLKSSPTILTQIYTAYTLCPNIPISGFIAPKYSHTDQEGVAKMTVSVRGDQIAITQIYLSFKLQVHHKLAGQFCSFHSLRMRMQPPIPNIVSHCEKGKMDSGGFKSTIKCCRPGVIHVTFVCTHWPELYIKVISQYNPPATYS